MLELDDVFELSLWGLELVGDGASEPRAPATATLAATAAARGPARLADPFSPVGRLPYLAKEKGTARASRVRPRRRAADGKLTKKS